MALRTADPKQSKGVPTATPAECGYLDSHVTPRSVCPSSAVHQVSWQRLSTPP